MNDNLKDILRILLITLAIILLEFVGRSVYSFIVEQDTPTDVVDSLKTVNNNIDENIKHLDSIKNEEINNIRNLDRDSTIKLFKEYTSK